MQDDPLEYGRNDLCWCGRGRKYKWCHGDVSPASRPGAPLPPDPDDGSSLYLSPTTMIDADALARGTADRSAPIYMPGERESPRPERIEEAVRLLAAADVDGVRSITDIARERFELLDSLGLGTAESVDEQVERLAPADWDTLRSGVLRLAKQSVVALYELDRSNDPPTVLWAEQVPSARLVGQTMLWAHHYLVPDRLAQALADDAPDASSVARGIATVLHERPLVLSGLVVPVLSDLTAAVVEDEITRRTQEVLDSVELMEWVDRQLIVEGPTAREVLLFSARDDISRTELMFFYGRIDPDSFDEETGRFRSRMLQRFDPEHDYEPWIKQTRRQVCSALVQSTVRELMVGEALGGTYVTNSLFRGRMLARMERHHPADALVRARVPYLSEAPPADLAALVGEHEAVDAMRSAVGRAIRRVEQEGADAQDRAMKAFVEEISERGDQLGSQLAADFKHDVFRYFLAGSALFFGGAVGGPAGVCGAGLATMKLLGDTVRRTHDAKRNDAFLLWLASERR